MLILTEKKLVAEDFAKALSVPFHGGFFSNGKVEIAFCKGHLYELEEPDFYDPKWKSWRHLPVLPDYFCYRPNKEVESLAKLVIRLLQCHRNDDILIATDADREGEIIARECLMQAQIRDFTRIKRFWVSEALTPKVISDGIERARPLSDYNSLAAAGFARQHGDWLVGINLTRAVTAAAGQKMTVGRVQTAVLSAIEERCGKIQNFKSETYFEFEGVFGCQGEGNSFTAKFQNSDGKRAFKDASLISILKKSVGKRASVNETERTQKKSLPPRLYNLTAVQKDAFRRFGFSATETLDIIQNLYEKLKCVSYPRTPSRVMGTDNADLCSGIFTSLAETDSGYAAALPAADLSVRNTHIYNDRELEAHHALIPLCPLPPNADENEAKIFSLISERFRAAFLPPCKYELCKISLHVCGAEYTLTGKTVLDPGWTAFARHDEEKEQDGDDPVPLPGITQDSIILLEDVKAVEKHTTPPKYFDEASILAFMENPKNDTAEKKLAGLGTQATRHTFLSKLTGCGYIEKHKERIIVTDAGKGLLSALRKSPMAGIADVSATTEWEEKLAANPQGFESEIRNFIKESVSADIAIETAIKPEIACPKCGNAVRRGKKNWFCSEYKAGCNFSLWDTICGTRLSETDAKILCEGGKTNWKKFVSSKGNEFKARLFLDRQEGYKVTFEFKK